jgi:hypothetical protein
VQCGAHTKVVRIYFRLEVAVMMLGFGHGSVAA